MAQVTVRGSVYGGGNLADVKTNTKVDMSAGTVMRNVFGGGKGKADNFTCDKAMVGDEVNDVGVELVSGEGENAVYTLKEGGTTVIITNGTVEGDVYGGGEVGRVERNTIVTIGTAGDNSLTPVVKGHVFGAGKGVETHGYSALVRGNTTVTLQGKAEVWQNVHGGGEKASVGRYQVAITPELAEQYHVAMGMPCYLKAGGKCTVNIQDNATIGKEADTGDVYGAGQGIRPFRTYTNPPSSSYEDRMNYSKRMVNYTPYDAETGKGHKSEDENKTWDYYVDEEGNQDQRYVWEYFPTDADYLLYVETLARASETDVVIGGKRETTGNITSSGSPTVKGTVYGGSESGFVYYGTVVNIPSGTVNGDAFGGGKGLASYSEAGRVKRNTNLTISGGTVEGNVYGGGSLGDVGNITKDFTSYNHTWKKPDGTTDNAPHNNGITSDNTNTGICNVTITAGTVGVANPIDATKQGNVFGAGRGLDDTWWCEKAMVFATKVNITAGTVNGSVFGGGEIGRVEDDVKVTIGDPSVTGNLQITGSVFGAGKGLVTHGYSALVRGNSDVTVQGKAKVAHSVYGGGEIATVGRYVVVGGVPTEPDGGGVCTVIVKDDAEITEDVFGAGQGVDPVTYKSSGTDRSKRMMVYDSNRDTGEPSPSTWEYADSEHKYVWEYFTEDGYKAFLETLALASDTEVEIGGTTGNTKVKGSVYGGSESGFLQRHTQVSILNNSEIGTTTNGNDVDGYVFGGGKGIPGYAAGGRVSGYTNVTINGGILHGSVFGGGENGVVKGGIDVNMTAGTVNKDVYGGGALADTNTSNGSDYIAVPGITTGTSVTGLYEKEYISPTETTAQNGVTYYELKGDKYVVKSVKVGDPLTNLYVVNYKTTSDETAQASKTYFNNTFTTSVDLLGGTIKGDAYGGGLGQKNGFNGVTSDSDNIPAVVYGDINVNLGSSTSESATHFYITYDTDDNSVVKSGRVFGCNNLYGSPQGDVTVTVYRTVNGYNASGETIEKTPAAKKKSETESDHTYELAAVYGGGNLAPYTASGKKTHVVIYGCDLTSILTVYGGGNAAAVTEASVDVWSCYEIGALFGGGNGKDKFKNDNGWQTNPGADVNGNTTTYIYGGTIHEAYGASNEKGTITGTVTIDVADSGLKEGDDGYCELDVEKLVGAGKNADVNGDLILVMGCKPSTKIPLVYGGADNANVNGDVELTITSGNFGKVFGGNNDGGIIMGHIKLNIEETGDCGTPITIDELYLGGNEAAYSRYGYYQPEDPTTHQPQVTASGRPVYLPRTAEMYAITDQSAEGYTPAITGEVYGTDLRKDIPYDEPVLNVISCTRIGKVFGGGYGTGAALYGNPTVNINMIPGSKASQMTSESGADATDTHRLGVIGDVFGGGNAADVYGNTTVNIGTATTVEMNTEPLHLGAKGTDYTFNETTQKYGATVEGAYIKGNVFGGGNQADVKGNTAVNVCAVAVLDSNDEPTGEYTTVDIIPTQANGYEGVKILGSVYGGGNLGSVGTYTYATEANNGKNPGSEISTDTYTGMPTGFTSGTATSRVTIMGYAEIGPDGMQMVTDSGEPDDAGHVFGASRGTVDPLYNQDFATTADRQDAIAALSTDELNAKLGRVEMLAYTNETHVTIGGHAFVKGSVYGGSENGHVLDDTYVTIQDDCQIGNGEGKDQRYTNDQWTNETPSDFAECAHWPFGQQTGDFK